MRPVVDWANAGANTAKIITMATPTPTTLCTMIAASYARGSSFYNRRAKLYHYRRPAVLDKIINTNNWPPNDRGRTPDQLKMAGLHGFEQATYFCY